MKKEQTSFKTLFSQPCYYLIKSINFNQEKMLTSLMVLKKLNPQ